MELNLKRNSVLNYYLLILTLVYEIKGKGDVYEKNYSDKDLFDFSNYPGSSKFYDDTNKIVYGKLKDEQVGKVYLELSGLKSKMYSIITVDNECVKEKIRAKDLNKKLKHNEFIDFLFNKKVIGHNIKRIQSDPHRLGTYDAFKISLSCFDDKRYILDDGIDSLVYFHKNICVCP